ncbi:hypothetical protein RND71_021761 [Anisodus tanguticus]|uniref:Uncharacterized protein n=1 Tax=Anisodus tanguticus TaxID=243964 RepID=A0AAE1RXQ5_9SOLA|nr:hypothetical protein RND71_021761 [Anisodus tanguticus]
MEERLTCTELLCDSRLMEERLTCTELLYDSRLVLSHSNRLIDRNSRNKVNKIKVRLNRYDVIEDVDGEKELILFIPAKKTLSHSNRLIDRNSRNKVNKIKVRLNRCDVIEDVDGEKELILFIPAKKTEFYEGSTDELRAAMVVKRHRGFIARADTKENVINTTRSRPGFARCNARELAK